MLIKIVVSVTFGVEFELNNEEWSLVVVHHEDSKHRGLKTEENAKRMGANGAETKEIELKNDRGRRLGAGCTR